MAAVWWLMNYCLLRTSPHKAESQCQAIGLLFPSRRGGVLANKGCVSAGAKKDLRAD